MCHERFVKWAFRILTTIEKEQFTDLRTLSFTVKHSSRKIWIGFGFLSKICTLQSAWKILKLFCLSHLPVPVNLNFQQIKPPKTRETVRSWLRNTNLFGDIGMSFWFNLFNKKRAQLLLNKICKFVLYSNNFTYCR